jgi:hypothetical protein
MRPVTILLLLACLGCAGSTSRLELLTARPGVVGLKLLYPGVEARSCAASVLGIGPPAPRVEDVVARLLARDDEAQVLADAEVRWDVLLTGLYNRRCVSVRGDLARPTSTLLLPAPAGGHAGHHHGP